MPEIERPVDLLDVYWAMLYSFGKANNGRGLDGMLFPVFSQRYLNFSAKVYRILRVCGEEKEKLITIMFVGRIGQNMGRKNAHKIEVAVDLPEPGHHIFA